MSIDLHTHSTASDGTMSPSEIVAYAARKGLSAISITDHDSVDGVEEAVTKVSFVASVCFSISFDANLEVIPGSRGVRIDFA